MSIFSRESEFNSAALNKLIREIKAKAAGTVYRTYNPDCPDCVAGRLHTEAGWEHHPDARHGFSPEQGWTKKMEPRSDRENPTA